jgi:hypothetical protein
MEREERDQLIVELRSQGLSLSQVGERVGLSGTRVSRILNGIGTPLNPEAMVRVERARTMHRCATPGCDGEMAGDRRIYSEHTGLSYCWTGEGCWLWSPEERREKRAASVEASVEVVAKDAHEDEYGWAVLGRSGPLGQWLTREGADELMRVSGGKVVPQSEVLA